MNVNIEDIIQAKKEKRSFYRKKRKNITEDERETLDKILFDKAVSLKEFREASVILAYYPINDEINTLPIIEYALSEGKRVALPISSTEHHTLSLSNLRTLQQLQQ